MRRSQYGARTMSFTVLTTLDDRQLSVPPAVGSNKAEDYLEFVMGCIADGVCPPLACPRCVASS